MDEQFDFVVIGAGPAGEAAAYKARARGATVAVVDRELFGGSCPFWACMPSKTLLHAAAIHAGGGNYDWARASARRDYMISREGTDFPSDAGHVAGLEAAGAVAMRGTARIAGPGRVLVTHDGTEHELHARHIVVAVGSTSKVPPIDGIDTITPWTNREATSTRELPASLVILGGGPTGIELAQVFARYGVPTALVASQPRVNPKGHPRNSAALEATLRADGVEIRTGVRAVRVRARAATSGAHVIDLSDGTSVAAHEVLLAVGRTVPLAGLGLETLGIDVSRGTLAVGPDLRIAPDVFVVGDPAGPEMHTHLSHYQGEMAVRMALGDDVRPDYRAIPNAVYTDPEVAGVGMSLEEAVAAGHDAFEEVVDLATTAKGYVAEATGHVTIVVDRPTRTLLGAFIAGPAASEVIHEAVLAIRTRTTLDVLADTIHAFPTVARAMGGLFAQAVVTLEAAP
ncbi:MAG TPA: NAD(P)/FAD-dependent oxidoreductase [Verrucomicrobiae bacterium]|nr:NAD(P)/FAD-dependent oxidoreductase [Verrucomicrobiae bacterium]